MCCRPALVLACLWLLAACQPLPRPFAPDSKQAPTAASVEVSPRAGLVVDRIDGVGDSAQAEMLRNQLARALQERDVVASLRLGHRHSYWLQGEVRIAEREDGGFMAVKGHWVVLRPDGTVQDEFASGTLVPARVLREQPVAAFDRIALDAARAVEASVGRWEVNDGRRLALPPLAIGPIDGAPGDGRQALTSALLQALGAAGVQIREQPDSVDFVLLGAVNRRAAPRGRERVEIAWHLIRPDGRELGRIDQANELPRGRLDGSWGLLAQQIADGAAMGVVALLQQAADADSDL